MWLPQAVAVAAASSRQKMPTMMVDLVVAPEEIVALPLMLEQALLAKATTEVMLVPEVEVVVALVPWAAQPASLLLEQVAQVRHQVLLELL
jgi:hypothetical protein